ncbi:uncharacterized protein [Drosophila takahashii]|uniref:uncharacterized protein n=1 Tax=Drosophila takahashii TaxID=29030 RepID=UPI003898D9DD
MIVQIEAQTRPDCPEFCPAVYQPVCGKAKVRGQLVRCEFGNGCVMGVSACRRKIINLYPVFDWCEIPLEKCKDPSPNCSELR